MKERPIPTAEEAEELNRKGIDFVAGQKGPVIETDTGVPQVRMQKRQLRSFLRSLEGRKKNLRSLEERWKRYKDNNTP